MPEEHADIIQIFPNINKEELKSHLQKYHDSPTNKSIPLGLFVKGKLRVYGRYNAVFSGCRPFYCTNVQYVDEFLKRLSEYRGDKGYYRLTFEGNEKLAKFLEKRGYKLYHHMWIMEKVLWNYSGFICLYKWF